MSSKDRSRFYKVPGHQPFWIFVFTYFLMMATLYLSITSETQRFSDVISLKFALPQTGMWMSHLMWNSIIMHSLNTQTKYKL